MSGRYLRNDLRVFWGDDSLQRLDTELARSGSRRAVLVVGRTLGSQPAVVERVADASGGRVVATFDRVRSHSPLESVLEAVSVLRQADADSLIALGGGSASVTARAANILYAESGDIRELSTRYLDDGSVVSPKLRAPKLPQLVVATTATTSSARAGTAVTRLGHGERFLMFDPKVRARAIIVDPSLAMATPPELLWASAVTALTVAMEGMLSSTASLFSNGVMANSARSLSQLLPEIHSKAPGRSAVVELILAGISAGDGANTASGGLTTALSHVLGHQIDTHNGAVDAILLPHVLRFMRPVSEAAFATMGWALGCAAASVEDVLAERLSASSGVPRLRDLGVPESLLPTIAEEAMSEYAIRTVPRSISHDDMRGLLQSAW